MPPTLKAFTENGDVEDAKCSSETIQHATLTDNGHPSATLLQYQDACSKDNVNLVKPDIGIDKEDPCEDEQAVNKSTSKSFEQSHQKVAFMTSATKQSEERPDCDNEKYGCNAAYRDIGKKHDGDDKLEETCRSTREVDIQGDNGGAKSGDFDGNTETDNSETEIKDTYDGAPSDISEEPDTYTDETVVEKEKAPDGGWGWLIVLGVVLLRCMIGGIIRSHGILFLKFRERFHGSATSTALLTSVSAFLRLLVGPAVSILTNRFACRNLQAVGVVITATGLIATAYMPSQGWVFVTFSCLGGLGRAFILVPNPILLSRYFDKRRSKAFGLASTGFSLGGFALVPVVELLFQAYGFQGAFLILGGFVIQIFVFIALFRPLDLHRKLAAKRASKNDVGTKETVLLVSKEILYEEKENGSAVIVLKNERSRGANALDTNTPPLKPLNENVGEIKDGKHTPTCDNGDEVIANRKTCEKEQTERLLDHESDQNEEKLSVRNGRKLSTIKTDTSSGKKKKKLVDLTILKDVRYVCYVVATMCFTLPSSGLFLPSLAIARGVTEIEAALLPSVTAGFDFAARTVTGFVLDLKTFRNIRPEINNGVTFLLCVVMALFPSMRTYQDFVVLCAVNGMLQGVKNAQGSVIVMDMLGVDKLASSMAVTMTAQGISVFIGPTISGNLVDKYGSYDGVYYFGACAIFTGACIMAFGQIRKRYVDRAKRNKDNNSTSDSKSTDRDNNYAPDSEGKDRIEKK